MPSRVTLTLMNAVHRGLIAVSRGKAGWSMGGMPVLELTTTGRRSGRQRSTMLTAPLTLDEGMVVVASRGGDHQHPAWFLNLQADPHVQVAAGGAAPEPMVARVLTPAERAEAWPRITARYRNYAGYQERTAREIPLVVLAPESSSTP
ncbi:nitroreductase/quinone reductase family protein [Actinotalea sp.]|uniref:nitroreductase/quinone reductase family protein n=1 Tax=Actinotalea sp. TaxID=1872145 RepID=UPI003565E60B